MEKLESFKGFVKKNPSLIKYVKNGDNTWQGFYEIYDLYGEDDSAWSDYLSVGKVENKAKALSAFSLGEVLTFIKSIDLDSLQESVGSLQRVLGVFSDLTNKNSETKKEEYRPRPLYKHFDD